MPDTPSFLASLRLSSKELSAGRPSPLQNKRLIEQRPCFPKAVKIGRAEFGRWVLALRLLAASSRWIGEQAVDQRAAAPILGPKPPQKNRLLIGF